MDLPAFFLSCWCGPTAAPQHEEAVVEVRCPAQAWTPAWPVVISSCHFLLPVMVLSLSSQLHGFRKGALSTVAAVGSGRAKFVLHARFLVVLSELDWTVLCLCQGSTGAAWPFSRDKESGGAVPQGPGELQAEEPLCSLGELPAVRQAWVMPETRTTEGTNLSQACVLFFQSSLFILFIVAIFFPVI